MVVVHTQHDESARGMCFGHVGGDFRLRPFRSGGCVTAHSVSKPASHISCNVQHQLATSQNAKATSGRRFVNVKSVATRKPQNVPIKLRFVAITIGL
ncbi:hypothetical protein EYC84_010261 [Monilinia fructicola]|uniref:Uncharacterized protein n=1 Tax=Monilinia fructicola TaxID=38448 RepID=A0A5M9JEN5_MONFR|nr:hypothetical protein EYC84_010261 [Monilinia fructicola]